MDSLRPDAIFGHRNASVHVARHGEILDTTGSTMDAARDRLLQGVPDGYVVLAEHQTAGRGRAGLWQCPPRLGLLMSVVLHVGLPASDQRLVVLMGAVAATEALNGLGVPVWIKWPNDLVVVCAGGAALSVRKLGGVLVHRVARPDGSAAHVLGIGLNVNQASDELPPGAIPPATSMLLEKGRSFNRSSVCRAVLTELDRWYRLLALGKHERILARWRSRSCLLGEAVRARVSGRVVSGKVLGIRSTGQLILRDSTGCEFLLSDEQARLLL